MSDSNQLGTGHLAGTQQKISDLAPQPNPIFALRYLTLGSGRYCIQSN